MRDRLRLALMSHPGCFIRDGVVEVQSWAVAEVLALVKSLKC